MAIADTFVLDTTCNAPTCTNYPLRVWVANDTNLNSTNMSQIQITDQLSNNIPYQWVNGSPYFTELVVVINQTNNDTDNYRVVTDTGSIHNVSSLMAYGVGAPYLNSLYLDFDQSTNLDNYFECIAGGCQQSSIVSDQYITPSQSWKFERTSNSAVFEFSSEQAFFYTGRFSLWFYDNASDTTAFIQIYMLGNPGGYTRYPFQIRTPATGQYYGYLDVANQVCKNITDNSSLPRTTGWHKLEVDTNGTHISSWVDSNPCMQNNTFSYPYEFRFVTQDENSIFYIDNVMYSTSLINDTLNPMSYQIANETPSNTAPVIDITNPQNLRTNMQEQIEFNVTDIENATLDCTLYVDNVFNQTNAAVANSTLTNFSLVWKDGVSSYHINCTDEVVTTKSTVYLYDFDPDAPVINIVTPSSFNTTTFTNYTMTIEGNVTDDAIYRVNRTIYFPNGTVLYNNYSGDLPNVTVYSWLDVFNTTLYPANDSYQMYIESADPHTDKFFKPAKTVMKDQDNKKLRYELDYDNVEIQLIDGNVLGQFQYINTTKLEDRYTFELVFKNNIPPNSRMVFRVHSDEGITYLDWSGYKAHFIVANHYWVDFEGVEGELTVTKINKNTYDVEIITSQLQKVVKFESLGGLNENDLWITFEIQHCVPDWSCNGFGDCNITDTQSCNSVIDNNACGIGYTGDYTEFGNYSCNYCDADTQLVSTSVCMYTILGYLKRLTFYDYNYSKCYNITGLASDNASTYIIATYPNLIAGHYSPGYVYDYQYNATAGAEMYWAGQSCSQFDYTADDIPESVISGVVKGIIVLSIFIPVVFVIILFIYLKSKRWW